MSSKSPFGNGPFGEDGPNPDDLKRALKQNSTLIKLIVIIGVVVILGAMSYYTVNAEEVAVVTTFGKYTTTNQPGLHFKIPFVQQVQKLQAKRQLKQEFGFRTTSSGVQSQYTRGESSVRESLMLTGDLNVAIVEWIVHYQISDPVQFLFKIRNGEDTLRDLSESTMREVVGDYSVTEVLTSGREEILQKAKIRLAELCKDYETGISVQRVELKDSAPPDPVKPSFNEVNQAEQERDQKQNEALSQYNKEIPKARGQAGQVLEEAHGYAVERVNRAKGDVAKFIALQTEYADSPKVTRTRLYLETMDEVLSSVDKKVIVDEETKGMVPMLFPMEQNATQNRMMTGGAQ
ncbi:MAG: FtsH protease activity modulator HflK [Deltaproteobacteria bacterium]|nr:FtsH protease activity modulator HflK [Deltaproteobacteria bacterium]MBN2671735.1 FtsH protease activity modulator HflK [Deltaproteobacteria bacterium]